MGSELGEDDIMKYCKKHKQLKEDYLLFHFKCELGWYD